MKRIGKLLFLLLTLPVMLSGSYGAPETSVHGVEDLNLFFQDMSMSLAERRSMRLKGFLNKKNLEENINKSNCFDYASHWQYVQKGKGALQVSLEYHDSSRLLAAYFNPRLEKELSTQERLALKEVKKRTARFKFDGLSRQEIVKILVDDAYLRRGSTSVGARDKGSCVDLILRRRATPESFARYIFVLASLYDIPCRIVRAHGGLCWNMIQMEDGEWYHLERGIGTNGAVFNLRTLPAELENRYPASPAKLPDPLPWYKSLKDFWAAASKSYAAGEPALGGVLSKYPGKREFMESFEKYVAEGNEIKLADMYLPAAAARNVYVRVVFDQNSESDEKEKNEEEKTEGILNEGTKTIRKFRKLLDDAA